MESFEIRNKHNCIYSISQTLKYVHIGKHFLAHQTEAKAKEIKE